MLGAVLLDNRAFDKVADFLKSDHFVTPVHVRIFEVIASLIETGCTASVVTIVPYLSGDEQFEAAGGMKYLVDLMNSLVSVSGASEYGKMVYDLYLRREILAIAQDAVEAAYDVSVERSAEQEIDTIEQRLFELSALGAKSDTLSSMGSAVDRAVEMAQSAHRRGGGVIGTPTGLRDADRMLSGLHASDLFILAGRPSMGKTSLATTIAVNAARYFRDTEVEEDKGKIVAFFSLEMSSEQLAMRVLAARTGLDHHKIRTGGLSGEDFEKLVAAKAELESLPLHIDDQPGPTISAIRVRCRRLSRKLKKKIGLVVVDYLQLVTPTRENKSDGRVQEVSGITRGLKAIAKNLGVPMLALSQLSRALENREDKRPQLSDLRESGSIEQDADEVGFVYREQYYLERNEPQQRTDESTERFHDRHSKWETRRGAVQNIAELIIAKQRHGPVGFVRLRFDAARTWFEDLEERYQETPHQGGPAHAAGAPPPEQFGLGLEER